VKTAFFGEEGLTDDELIKSFLKYVSFEEKEILCKNLEKF